MKQSAIRILLLGIGIFVGASSSPNGAAAQTQTDFGRCIASVPTDWGMLKGVSQNYGLAFEDSAETCVS